MAGDSLFSRADADHDGVISLHEFKALGQIMRDVRVLREQLSATGSELFDAGFDTPDGRRIFAP